ncbi:L-sorbosone dehydrogenase [Ditylenchus destructor]|nr:L-sorbosone dehydrogenase [Ditylenchus destructor]
MTGLRHAMLALAAPLALTACDKAPDLDQTGASPQLPGQKETLLPPMKIARPAGWNGAMPSVPQGFMIAPIATGLKVPRQTLVLPNGDVLVAEGLGGGAPKLRPKDVIAGYIKSLGKSGSKGGDRVTLLRDSDGDGSFRQSQPSLDQIADRQCRRYAPLCRHRFEQQHRRTRHGAGRGTRRRLGNRPGDRRAPDLRLGHPQPDCAGDQSATQALWAVVNERDELGADLVPDYMTSVKPGAFYGWPYSYYGSHVDPRVHPQKPEMVGKAIAPDYALGSHVAALGLTFLTGGGFGGNYADGAFVGEHGSWNRRQLAGYKVVWIPFTNGRPSGKPRDFVTGFIGPDGKARGRPVGVTYDPARRALLVADDLSNTVWRITPSPKR